MKILLFLLFIIFSALVAFSQEEAGWHLVREIDQVRIFEQHPADREEIDYKVVTFMDAPPDTMLAIMADFANYHKFLAFYESSKTLRQVSPQEFYGYGVLHPTASGQRRDVILHVTFTQLSNGWIGQGMTAPDYLPLKPGLVRDSVLHATWVIMGIKGEKQKCRYSYQVSIAKSVATQVFIQQLAQTNYENVQRLRGLVAARMNKRQ